MPLLAKPVVRKVTRNAGAGGKRTDWLVYCGTQKRRPVRFYHRTEAAARRHAAEFAATVKARGDAANKLTAEQAYDAASALLLLSQAGIDKTLSDVCREWLAGNADAPDSDAEIAETVRLYGRRFDLYDRHGMRVRVALGELAEAAQSGGRTRMSAITRDVVAAWLDGHGTSPATYNLHRAYALAFLNWAHKQGVYGIKQLDAVRNIEKRKVPYRPPCVFNAEQVESVMRWAEAQADADMLVPKFALGFFAGIRTAEIHRMTWGGVIFKDGEIRVERPKGVVGTPPRIVEMSDNLRAWLLKYQLADDEPVCYDEERFTQRKRAMVAELGIAWDDEENRNVMRHSFASAHMAMWRDVGKTVAALGHSQGAAVFKAHYWGIMDRDTAVAYWAIMPK